MHARQRSTTLGRPPAASTLTALFIAISFCWGGYLGYLHIEGVLTPLDRFENLTADWRFSLTGPRGTPNGVVICAIDDDAIREAKSYPLPRNTLARMVRDIARLEPNAVALDIAFLDSGNSEADKELAEALRSTKSVVAAVASFERAASTETQSDSAELAREPAPQIIFWPTPAIAEATRAGLVNIATDATGVPRFIPLMFRDGARVARSFALLAASLSLGPHAMFDESSVKLGEKTTSLDLGHHLALRFYGPRGAIKKFSAARVLRGELAAEEVRGQIVLFGATALGLGDVFATPFDRIVSGVEVMATGVSNLLHGDGLIRTPLIRKIDAASAIALAAAAVSFLAMRRIALAIGLACLVFLLWAVSVLAAFVHGYWLSMAVPLAAAVPVAVACGATRLGLERYQGTRLAIERAALAQLHSPLLVEHISRDPAFLDQPVHQNVAAVFVDLSSFTGFAEELGAERAQELLGTFQAVIERDVTQHGGIVVNFLGDGAMAIFGMPAPREDDAARAFRAVMQLQQSTSEWLLNDAENAGNRLRVRIGGHFGSAVISRLGPKHHQHITAVGDTINVSSRLLEVAKQLECRIVISEELLQAANAPEAATLEVQIRGRARPLRVRTWT